MGPTAAYGGGNYAAGLTATAYNPLAGGSSGTGMAPTMTAAASGQQNYAQQLNAANPAQPKTTSQALQASAKKPQPAEGTRAAREIQAWGGGGSRFEIAGRAAERGIGKVDNALVDIIQKASDGQPYNVQLFSGYRPGDRRQHGKGNAVDIALVDPYSGEALPNYQSAETFPQYETFAKRAYEIARRDYPELADNFRWGGYFGGGKGKYGATDTMHFDVNSGIGMGGGSWEGGLNPDQARRVSRMGAGRTQWAGLRPGMTETPPATMYAGDPMGVSGSKEQLAGGNMPTPRMRPERTQMAYAEQPAAPGPFDAVLDASANRQPQPPTPRSNPRRDTLQQPAPAAQRGGVVVQPGETLSAIAQRELGDPNRWREIAQANGISDPRRLQAGQSLVIPGGQAQRTEANVPQPRVRPRVASGPVGPTTPQGVLDMGPRRRPGGAPDAGSVPTPRQRPGADLSPEQVDFLTRTDENGNYINQPPQQQAAPAQRPPAMNTEADVRQSVTAFRDRLIGNGAPPGPDLDRAVADYERSIRQQTGIRPAMDTADIGRSVSNFREKMMRDGAPPGPALDEAVRNYERALRQGVSGGGQPQASMQDRFNDAFTGPSMIMDMQPTFTARNGVRFFAAQR